MAPDSIFWIFIVSAGQEWQVVGLGLKVFAEIGVSVDHLLPSIQKRFALGLFVVPAFEA